MYVAGILVLVYNIYKTVQANSIVEDELAEAPALQKISAGRTRHWLHAIELIQENALSGIGTGLYRFSDAHTNLSHPHNFILQFAVDWGIPGALCAMFLLV